VFTLYFVWRVTVRASSPPPDLVLSSSSAPHLGTTSTIRCPSGHGRDTTQYLHLTGCITMQWLAAPSDTSSPSWEAIRSSASQLITHILFNPKVHYHIPKHPPPVPILSQFNPAHASTSHYLKIHFHINRPPTPRTSKSFLPMRSSSPKPSMNLSRPRHVPHAAPILFFDSITRIIFDDLQKSQSPSLCSLLHSCYLVPLRPTYLPQHRLATRTEIKTSSASVTACVKISCS